MIRFGVRRGERDGDGVPAKPFQQEVWSGEYEETWIEGMSVLHNPRAKIPLEPMMLAGAAHEFLQPDGRLQSLIPEFHPVFSNTLFITQNSADKNADEELAQNTPESA
jgi:hypothetical protein